MHLLRLAEEPGELIIRQIGEYGKAQQFGCFDHLNLAQILMDELHRHGTFANSRGHAFDRTVAYIAHRKYTWHIRFQKKWIAIGRPTLRTLSTLHQVGPGPNESTFVPFNSAGQPIRPRQGSDEDEHRTCRHAFDL